MLIPNKRQLSNWARALRGLSVAFEGFEDESGRRRERLFQLSGTEVLVNVEDEKGRRGMAWVMTGGWKASRKRHWVAVLSQLSFQSPKVLTTIILQPRQIPSSQLATNLLPSLLFFFSSWVSIVTC